MRIIINFEGKSLGNNYNSYDIIISNHFNDSRFRTILKPDFSLCDEDTNISIGINKFFQNMPKAFRNTYYYKVFRPVCSVIKQIEGILSDHIIDRLVLVGGSPFAFITLFGGEGEGKKYLYKSSWLFNSFLYQYFRNIIAVDWKFKKSKFLFKRFYFFRERTFFYLRLGKRLMSTLFLKRNNFKSLEYTENINIFAFVNLPLQYEHISDLLSELPKKNLYYFSPFYSILSKKKIRGIYSYQLTLGNVCKAFNKFINLKKKIRTNIFFFEYNGKKIEIEGDVLLMSLLANFVFFYSELYSLIDQFNKLKINNKSFVVTDMTFGEDIILINEFTKSLRIPHYNFQLVAMAKMILPQMDLADKYFLYSRKTLELYQKFNSSYQYYLPIPNNKVNLKKAKDDQLTLSLFTQPDLYTEKYLTFLNLILPKIQDHGDRIKFIIKPHYRQNKISQFEQIAKSYAFVYLERNDVLAKDVIEKSDFILSMTSSVLFEGIIRECPGVIINFFNLDKTIYDNDICFPNINFEIKTLEKFMDIIHNSNDYKALYKVRRDNWINSNRGINIKQLFHVD